MSLQTLIEAGDTRGLTPLAKLCLLRLADGCGSEPYVPRERALADLADYCSVEPHKVVKAIGELEARALVERAYDGSPVDWSPNHGVDCLKLNLGV